MIYQIETKNRLARKVLELLEFLHWIAFVNIDERKQADTEIIGESVARSMREVKAHIAGKKELKDISIRIHEL